MVTTLDGNSEIGAHVRRNLCYLICARHLICSKAVTRRFFFLFEIGAQVWSNLYSLFCLWRIRSRAVTRRIFFFSETSEPIFLQACTTCSELSSNIKPPWKDSWHMWEYCRVYFRFAQGVRYTYILVWGFQLFQKRDSDPTKNTQSSPFICKVIS